MAGQNAIAALLREVSETHHAVFRITDSDDPDWASRYAEWLLDHSELPGDSRQGPGARPPRERACATRTRVRRDVAL